MHIILKKFIILLLGISICYFDFALKILALLILKNFYSKWKWTPAYVIETLKKESCFTLLYIIWLLFFGEFLLEYLPVLLQCMLIWIEIG